MTCLISNRKKAETGENMKCTSTGSRLREIPEFDPEAEGKRKRKE